MNDLTLDVMREVIASEMGNAFEIYADILSIALPVLFTFGACGLLVNLVWNAAFKGKIQWWGK